MRSREPDVPRGTAQPIPATAPRVVTWQVAPDGSLHTAAPAGVDPAALRPPVAVDPIVLTRPTLADADAFLAAVAATPALAEWGAPAATADEFAAWLAPGDQSRTERFLVRDAVDGGLVGFVSVQQIAAGRLRAAALGYGGFAGRTGRGLMTAGVAAVVVACFTKLPANLATAPGSSGSPGGFRAERENRLGVGLGLHRVEANIQPGNDRSLALVRRLGFRYEGFSPRLLYLNGAWRDHERYALTVEDWLTDPTVEPDDRTPDGTEAERATVVVDAANVVGARPNGWWRDRAAAATKLVAAIRALEPADPDHRWVVVLEGAARAGAPAGGDDLVRVVHAAGSGDATIAAEAAAAAAARRVVVVTADRALRGIVEAAGATTVGPRWLWDRIDAGR